MGLNWSFQRGGGSNQKKTSLRGVWIFLEQHIMPARSSCEAQDEVSYDKTFTTATF